MESFRKLISSCKAQITNRIKYQAFLLGIAIIFYSEPISLKTLKIWVSLIQDCLQILRKPDEKTRLVTNFIEVIVNEESIVKLFSNILALQVPNNKQIQQCLMSTSGFVEIDQPLNALKTIVLKAFNRFLETLIAGKSLLDFTKTKFYDFIKDDGVKGILNSVFLLCKSEELNIDEILKVYYYHNFPLKKFNRTDHLMIVLSNV